MSASWTSSTRLNREQLKASFLAQLSNPTFQHLGSSLVTESPVINSGNINDNDSGNCATSEEYIVTSPTIQNQKTGATKSSLSSKLQHEINSGGHQVSSAGFNFSNGGSRQKSVDGGAEPLVTFPESPPPLQQDSTSSTIGTQQGQQMRVSKDMTRSAQIRYHQVRSTSSSSSSLQSATSTATPIKTVQEEIMKVADMMEQQSQNSSASSSTKLESGIFTAEKKALGTVQQSSSSSGMYNHHIAHAQSSHNYTVHTTKALRSSAQTSNEKSISGHQLLAIGDDSTLSSLTFSDLNNLSSEAEADKAIDKYSSVVEEVTRAIKSGRAGVTRTTAFHKLAEMMRLAWDAPIHGERVATALCTKIRNCGAIDLVLAECGSSDELSTYAAAKLLQTIMVGENRDYIVNHGLDNVVNMACSATKQLGTTDHSRVSTGILEHLFKHSEDTCGEVIKLGGLDAIIKASRKSDVDTLRHCAGALANLSLYGGAENQEAMIKRQVPMWLFPLAFNHDDNIKYHACLAISVLVANKEIEADVIKSGTLDLVEPFVTTHTPSEFAKTNYLPHGQGKNWLQRLVPVLSSKREEAMNLAAFHFCMEAGVKQKRGLESVFKEIGAIEPLKKVASCPNAIASKFAAQALRLIGEAVPHKLSQQVPLWSVEDVCEWVKQIGFIEYASKFADSRVDGDLLLQLTEGNLRDDIGILNGIRRRRFTRELQNLKKIADYSSRDVGNLNNFLQSIGPEFCIYTYSMLNAGVDKDSIRCLSQDQLVGECGIINSIHRIRILESIKTSEHCLANLSEPDSDDKTLDAFISYRRSTGSQLASLLKVHLQVRGFSVFIDVERLEAGKFDNNLLQSIKQARNFLLVLTPNALERCENDNECKDWVHREIVAALQAQCNIIPIIDSFQWPEPEQLPDDMRAICHFNGIRWIHDYQDACVDKLERFMKGELSGGMQHGRPPPIATTAATKGDLTPNTPAIVMRSAPTYQVTPSSSTEENSQQSENVTNSKKYRNT